MPWLPIGPDFVHTPRNQNFKRLSRRNEWGRQGLPATVAIETNDPLTIYTVERPSSGGSGTFRTRDGGNSWFAISDSLIQADALADPNWLEINPVAPNIIFLATHVGQGFYISNDRGNTWGAKKPVPGRVWTFKIDPNTAGDPANTHIIAGTNNGVYRSIDSGDTWVQILAGDCHWLALHIPAAGTAHYFAGIRNAGLFYTTVPTDPWTNLNTQGIGLPQYVAPAPGMEEIFTQLRVEICPKNTNRVYVWLAKPNKTEGLYTSTAPTVAWTKIAAAAPPDPGQGLYNFEFAIAPNSSGNGTTDVLFIGSVNLFRSIDAGVTWTVAGTGFHADQQAFAFHPPNPPGATIPVCYVGNDGGLAKSTKFCDPLFNFGAAIAYFDELDQYIDNGCYENLNYTKQCSAVYQYASHSDMNALNYIGCQDTGVSAGAKTLGWRGIADADGGAMAVAPGADGVKLWGRMGAYGGFPSFRILLWTDKAEFSPGAQFVKLEVAGGPDVNNTSNFEIDANNDCLVGVYVRDKQTTIAGAIVANAAAQAVTPASMAGIAVDTVLTIDPGVDGVEEHVVVTAVTVNTFSAIFTKNHNANAPIRHNRSFASKMGHDAICRQISQNFGLKTINANGSPNGPFVSNIIAHPSDPNLIICNTSDTKVWRTDAGAAANEATVWNEVAMNKPAGGNINAITITPDSHIYVLYRLPVNGTDAAAAVINTALYEISTGNWIGQVCNGAPVSTNQQTFGKLVAHPFRNDILFAAWSGKLFQLTKDAATGAWDFLDISEGLPNVVIYDLWAGFHTLDRKEENIILRVAIPTRGVWEKVFNQFGQDDSVKLYVRDHFLDQGLLSQSEDGLVNPYDPAGRVYHYKCADVKLDSKRVGVGVADFFQTDPEDNTPISHVSFNKLVDNSRSLSANHQTMVHVQVHNRSTQNANDVKVWAIFCNASAGVPGLNQSPSNANNFDFWSQFTAGGQIVPALPADSPWKSVGAPVTLNDINGFNPTIASWLWTTPVLMAGDPGHYCMVVFIHSSANPINETGFNVDYITPRNRQIGQKNLHIGEPLPPEPGGTPGGGAEPVMNEYIEFHNPNNAAQTTDFLFEFNRLPKELAVTLQFTRIKTQDSFGNSITNIKSTRKAVPTEEIGPRKRSFFGLLWCWIRNLFCAILNFFIRLFGGKKIYCYCTPASNVPQFDNIIYEVEPGKEVRVTNVVTDGFRFNAAYIRIRNTGTLPPGMRYHFDVQQIRNGVVIGGSEYVVCTSGNTILPVITPMPDIKLKNLPMAEYHRLKRIAQKQRYLAPWIEERKAQREEEMGKI